VFFRFMDSTERMVLEDSIIIWGPYPNDTGSHDISIEVYDLKGGYDTLSWVIKVAPNEAPEILSEASDMKDSVEAGENYEDTVHTVDKEGDPIYFHFIDSVAGMVLQDSIITWEPTASDTGVHNISIRVSDIIGRYDTLSWDITVIN